jgi:hypothetical protein
MRRGKVTQRLVEMTRKAKEKQRRVFAESLCLLDLASSSTSLLSFLSITFSSTSLFSPYLRLRYYQPRSLRLLHPRSARPASSSSLFAKFDGEVEGVLQLVQR